jgi:hypothetical protein
MNSQQCFKMLILISILLSASYCYDYQPKPIGEFNLGKSGYTDSYPIIARLTSGNYVTCFSGNTGSAANIYFMAHDNNGNTIKAPTQVNTLTLFNVFCFVAADTKGGFVVSWNRRDNSSINEGYSRYYDANFNPGAPIKFNTIVTSAGADNLYNSVTFTGKYFLDCFNPNVPTSGLNYIMTGQRLSVNYSDLSLSMVGASNTLLGNQIAGKIDYGCGGLSLGNGNFAIGFHGTQYGDLDIFIGIFKEDDLSVVNALTRINNNVSGTQANPFFTMLSNGNAVVSWWDQATNNGDAILQIFKVDGTLVGSNIKANTTGYCNLAVPKALGDDGFVIVYNANSFKTTYYQLFKNDGTKIGVEKKLSIISASMSYTFTDGFAGEFFSIYAVNNIVYGQIYYKDTNTCKDSTIAIGMDSIPKMQITLSNMTANYYIVLTQLPTNGTLKSNAGGVLITNKLFIKTDVYYNIATLKADSFYYSTNLVDAACQVTITPCYSSCFSCTAVGTVTAHSCKTCDTANARGSGATYPLDSDATMCYTSTTVPQGYFLNNNIWTKCAVGCKTCTGVATDPTTDMLCNGCIATYFPREDKLTSCFIGPFSGYYNDGTMFKKCFSSCLTCKDIVPTTSNNQCNACITGYFPAADVPTNCINSSTPGYYFDTTTSTYQKCFSSCKTCKITGTIDDHKCDSCLDTYHPRFDKMTNCYTGTIDLYYLDSNNIYQSCYSSCQRCSALGDTTNNKCDSCKPNYYTKIDNTTSCFTGPQNSYYLDGNIYKTCYTTCKTCFPTAYTTSNHQCTTCKTGYYPKSDNTSSCFTGTVPQYFLSASMYMPCYPSCATCKVIGTDSNHMCDTCLANYFQNSDKTGCFTGNVDGYYLQGSIYYKCYPSCKACSKVGNDTDHACDSCLSKYYPKVDATTSCFTGTINFYYFDLTNNIYKKCFTNCKTCTALGDATNNKCNSCIDKYYPKVDNMTNCFTSPTDFYYLDGSVFKNCYNSCQICSSVGTDANHQCTKCLSGYSFKIDNQASCFKGNIDNYYLDSNIYYKCYISCLTCTGAGTDANNKCTSCAKGYKSIGGTNNCTATGETLQGYYFVPTPPSYKPCYTNCLYCSGPGTDDKQNCFQCNTGLYMVDNTGNCFPRDKQITGYYFDLVTNNKFLPCYQSCSTCTEAGTDIKHKCAKCKDNYYPLFEDQKQCYDSISKVSGYAFDKQTQTFKACYKTCSECTASGDETANNCSACKDGLYAREDDISYCNSKDSIIKGYFFDETSKIFKRCYKSCYSCSAVGDIRTPNCIECIDSKTDCSGCNDFVHNDTCVNKCPDNTSMNENDKTCKDCQKDEFIFNNSCTTTCPDGYIKEETTCNSCKARSQYFYEASCVNSCPEGYDSDKENICREIKLNILPDKDLKADNSNKTVTNTTDTDKLDLDNKDLTDNGTPEISCKNNGALSTRFGLTYCDCSQGFTGIYCQLQIADDMNEYIGKFCFYFRYSDEGNY